MRLGDGATVRSGLVLARKQSKIPTEYRYDLLNLRSVNIEGYIERKDTDIYYAKESLNPEYISQEHDVIVRLSAPYTAVLIDDSTAGMVISSNFAIIRVNQKCFLPEYIYWLLNTAKVKRQIFENTSSNMLAAIKPSYFSEFNVFTLSLDEQQKIAAMNLLSHRECRLLRELAEEKEKYYTIELQQIQKRMRRSMNHDN